MPVSISPPDVDVKASRTVASVCLCVCAEFGQALTVAATDVILCNDVERSGLVKSFGFGAVKEEEALEELT